MEVLIFTLAEKYFGIMVENVKEIVEATKVTPVPLTPEYLEGVMNLRGDPVSIIDLKKKIGFEGKANSKDIILCTINDSLVGLRPDNVLNIHEVSSDALKDVPKSLKKGIESKYLKGIAEINSEKYIIINVGELI